ncbi:MAG TPA: right-handed parallel beta-helix repeat-containing protein, partial [Gaiellaceae bacterium]|nr:right-handed parallel beta-helix repeat-containing protein [Gaiellaceae bacterium]
ASLEAGITATGAVAPGGSLEIGRNRIAGPGAGIVVGADATVDANTINRLGEQSGTDGIVVDVGTLTVQPGDVRITGNRVHDRTGTGIALRTSVRTFMVKQNVLTNVGAGIAIEGMGKAERVAIEDNEVFDVATAEGEKQFVVGIHVAASTSAAIVGNTVARVAPAFKEGTQLAAILCTATEDVRIAGNTVDEVGPQDGYAGFAAGIAVAGPFERASVSDNSSRFGPNAAGPPSGTWWALVIESGGEEQTRIAGTTVVPVESGALAVTADGVFAVALRAGHAGVASNTLVGGGPGDEPACRVRVTGDIVADANQCRYEVAEDPTGILLRGSSIVASSNRLRGESAMLILQTNEVGFAAVGNLAAGGTHFGAPGNGLPPPWQDLNPTVP